MTKKKDKYGFTVKEREKYIKEAMKCYNLTRKQAEEWYKDEDALNL